jgi:hypothetical protein
VLVRDCSSMPSVTVNSLVIEPGVADHSFIMLELSVRKSLSETNWVIGRNMKRIDAPSFWVDFWNFWEPLPEDDEIEDILLAYERTALKTLDKHAPAVRRKITMRVNKVDISEKTRSARKEMRRTEHKWRRDRLTVDRDIFKKARNVYVSSVRKDKECSMRKAIRLESTNPKKLWKLLASRTGTTLKCSRTTTKEKLSKDERYMKAQSFAHFFVEKIDKINNTLGCRVTTSLSMPEALFEPLPSVLVLMDELEPVSFAELDIRLNRLPLGKNSTDDVIPNSLLKQGTAHVIIERLCNLSFSRGIFPPGLKRAVIKPILKMKGSRADSLTNYRPISNIKSIAKLIESIAASRLKHHLEKVSFLHPLQSAYRRSFSTETATLQVASDWYSSLDCNQLVCVASLDVSAAFDTVNYGTLSARLIQAGIIGRAHKWFMSYMTNRSAVVQYEDAQSQPFQLSSGVPQGSVLGPTLFNLYMADLARVLQDQCGSRGLKFHIYADDVLLYVSCQPPDFPTATEVMQFSLQIVEKWMADNYLMLNLEKTGIFLLHRKSGILPDVHPFSLMIGGKPVVLDTRGSFRWLGIEFDTSLTMSLFVSKTCRACFLVLRMLRQIRATLNKQSASLLCNALVCSRIDYCNSLLYGTNQDSRDKLQRVLNLAARIITGLRRQDHISPALVQLGWLKINERIMMKIAVLVFKALRGLLPAYLTSQVVEYHPRRSLRSTCDTSTSIELGTATGP